MSGSLKRSARRAAALLALAALPPGVRAEAPKKPKEPQGPAVRLKLKDLGVPPISAAFVNAGASMLTVNLLDDTHLLLTFSTRKLVPRIPGDPPDDEDRIVEGQVLELPSGKVLARADWHLHDHARYLWPIGHGRFVLRIRDSLSVFAPLANLASGKAFERVVLGHQQGKPVAVATGPDGGVLSVVTELPQPKTDKPKVIVVGDADSAGPKPVYAIDFYRVKGEGGDASPLEIRGAGVVRAEVAAILPLDADGYLWATQGKAAGDWNVVFNDFNGTTVQAGVVRSSCPPRLLMASRAEYLGLVCMGDETKPKLLSMGLDGHETWEEPFGEFAQTPAFEFAPAAGRFAMLRTSTVEVSESGPGGSNLGHTTTNQEVRVYQTESGDLLLRLPMSPVFRVPENFDLAEDGRALAVLHDDEIQVWTLPAPSKKDVQDLAEVMQFAPPANELPVSLRKIAEETAAAARSDTATAAVAAPVSTTTQAEVATKKTGEAGDTGASGPRKRPTLLNPGEVPEFKDKKAPVQ